MKKKVLIITYYWPPSGGAGVQRFLKFAKYLPSLGVKPYVLTVQNPTYPIVDETLSHDVPEEAVVFKSQSFEPFQIYARLTGKSLAESTKPTIALNSPDWKSRLSSWIRANIFIPDARAGWLLTARSKALEIIENHNIRTVITTGPPHSCHFAGKYVQQHAGVRWIADFRDPWTGVYYNQLLPRFSLAQSIDEHLEQRVLKYADEVIVISRGMADIQRKIVDRNYHIIPNGFDPADFKECRNKPKVSPSEPGKLTIRFLGSVREGAIPEGFLKAVSLLDDRTRLNIEFIGNSHPALQNLIKQLGLQSIVNDKPYVAHDEAIRLMSGADLLLLSINTTPGSEMILTGKLFEYLGSETPILFLGPTEGDAAKIIREMNQGACFEHHEVEKIKDFLSRFMADGITGSAPRKPEVEDHPYSRLTLTRQLAKLIA